MMIRPIGGTCVHRNVYSVTISLRFKVDTLSHLLYIGHCVIISHMFNLILVFVCNTCVLSGSISTFILGKKLTKKFYLNFILFKSDLKLEILSPLFRIEKLTRKI
jgi:hypothetical protein